MSCTNLQDIMNDALVPPTRMCGVFTRDVLRLPSAEWRAIRARVGELPAADEALIVDLRRKSMACVYAERSCERRLLKLQALEGEVLRLQEENAMLRALVRSLQ